MATHKTDLGTKWDVGVAINRTNPIPLDSTQNHSSLDTLQTYATSGATSYVGQQVNVIDSNGNLKGAYIIKNKQGELMELASSSSVESLSGVFTFKGLAEAVSPDLSYIVTCSAKSDQSIFPVGTAADLEGDLYYGWKTDGDRFWTDSSILNSASTQYIQGKGVLVWGVEYKDDFYFPANAMPAGDDGLIELQNSNGDSIFLTDDALPITAGTQYSVHNSENDVIGTGLGFSYAGYTFTESIDPYPISHTHTTIQANEANSGHVYQIGENEYASNGQIWVKLGSPVEDWIIL